MEMISIEGLDRVEVFRALYDRAKPQGLGFLHFEAGPLPREEAETAFDNGSYFDYFKGRVMKVNLGGNEFNPWLYDRDNGPGAAAEVVKKLREGSGHD